MKALIIIILMATQAWAELPNLITDPNTDRKSVV